MRITTEIIPERRTADKALKKEWKRYLQKKQVPHDISLKQLYVLRQLLRREFLVPSVIAEMLFCDRPTTTVVIRNLEKRGWVRNSADPSDGVVRR